MLTGSGRATSLVALLVVLCSFSFGQTTAFNYQGNLTDTGTPQSTYQMQFKLFDASAAGNQIGSTITKSSVTVTDGVFSVSLDFGSNVFSGANRFLEIGVRRDANESYTILSPRQQIASSPYSIRTISAQQADLALNSNQLGGVAASEYVTTTNGGTSFIRNGTVQQTGDYNISGTGVSARLALGLAAPRMTYLLDVNGIGQFTPGVSGGAIQFGTPNAELGMTIVGANRADVRFDGTTLKMVAGAGTGTPSSLSGLGINTVGNIGAGAVPNNNFRIDSFGPMRTFSTSAAHFVAETTGGTNSWARFYARSSNRSWFLGTSQNFNGDQFYLVDETAGATRFVISTAGFLGINNTNPQAGLDMRGTGLQTQERITDNTSVNSLVLQAGAGSNMKVTGYNYGTSTAVPLYISTDGANTVLNNGGGNVLQPGSGFGMPKAMVFVLANGNISRCYNGITGASVASGSTTTGCGFTSSVLEIEGPVYSVDFGFNITGRFLLLTSFGSGNTVAQDFITGRIVSIGSNTATMRFFHNETSTFQSIASDYFLIVY